MEKLWLIPEYEPAQRLCLSFVHEFYNTRFHIGKAICDIVRVALSYVDVEIFVSEKDLPHLEEEFKAAELRLDEVTLTLKSPGRALMAEYMPIIAQDSGGNGVALTFHFLREHADYRDDLQKAEEFGVWFAGHIGLRTLDLGFGFATAGITFSDDIAFVSEKHLGRERDDKLTRLRELFPRQRLFPVPPLTGDLTGDLDM